MRPGRARGLGRRGLARRAGGPGPSERSGGPGHPSPPVAQGDRRLRGAGPCRLLPRPRGWARRSIAARLRRAPALPRPAPAAPGRRGSNSPRPSGYRRAGVRPSPARRVFAWELAGGCRGAQGRPRALASAPLPGPRGLWWRRAELGPAAAPPGRVTWPLGHRNRRPRRSFCCSSGDSVRLVPPLLPFSCLRQEETFCSSQS